MAQPGKKIMQEGETPLTALRGELVRRKLDGFIVPHGDEYQNEYLPPCAERLAWLTGFTGSAGLAIVLGGDAAFFTDGRYTLQAAEEVDGADFDLRHIADEPPTNWLAGHLKTGQRLGYDSRLHTPDDLARYERAAHKAGASLVPCQTNPLDGAWADQPQPPTAPVFPYDLAYAGKSSVDKRRKLGAELKKAGAGAVVITAPDSIAWLLNIRGGDVAHTPLPLSYAVLMADGTVELFLDPAKISSGLLDHLGSEVGLHGPDDFGPALDRLAGAGETILVDPARSAAWVFDRLKAAGAKIRNSKDPCQLPKALKNDTECNGIRTAHLRDGAALTRFLAWLSDAAPGGAVSELAAADHLEVLRRESDLLRDLSFPTISGSGPNGAIVHYRVTAESDRMLSPGDLYLVDSGAQYFDGTTDVTRTVFIAGEGRAPDDEQRDHFTRVLKGHIALASARFPSGTTGSALDALARKSLWQVGLDYDHGTGHGVGCYLGVHEGPQRISKIPNKVALMPGMVVSNEPGYYRAGAYGIRIENLVLVIEGDMAGGERQMLGFETLTR
ncbi:MAG: aminopeptidase P family protein, partial [Rhodospirillaceae bacterium]|nr:aminopeptidase P family protein [Rhodospirillaceae bacterium]